MVMIKLELTESELEALRALLENNVRSYHERILKDLLMKMEMGKYEIVK